MSASVKDGTIHHDGEHWGIVGSWSGGKRSVWRGEREKALLNQADFEMHRKIHGGGVLKAPTLKGV